MQLDARGAATAGGQGKLATERIPASKAHHGQGQCRMAHLDKASQDLHGAPATFMQAEALPSSHIGQQAPLQLKAIWKSAGQHFGDGFQGFPLHSLTLQAGHLYLMIQP